MGFLTNLWKKRFGRSKDQSPAQPSPLTSRPPGLSAPPPPKLGPKSTPAPKKETSDAVKSGDAALMTTATQVRQREIQVFISSTFRDMQEERSALSYRRRLFAH